MTDDQTTTMTRSLGEIVATSIRDATLEVFTTMIGMEVSAGEPFSEPPGEGPHGGVVAFVGLAGDTYSGTGSLACSAELACTLSSQFLMTEVGSVDADVLDAVGEITNMVLGNVKSALEAELGPLRLSIPTVVYGKNFATRALRSESTVMPFACGTERLEISLGLCRRAERPSRAALEGV